MKFINPRTDYAFKKIFGSDKSKNILISFLNAILEYKDTTNEIVSVKIMDPREVPKIIWLKDTYLDVKVKTSSWKFIIIEMQVLNVEWFDKRVLYNLTKSYANQIKKWDDYSELNPVVALTITDFVMFKEYPDQYISNYILKEKKNNSDYNWDVELVFVELPKFKKDIEKLENIQDKRIYFLKEVDDLSVEPEWFKNIKEFNEAFTIANESWMDEEELDILERQQMFLRDKRNAYKKATRTWFEDGVECGREEGMKKWMKKWMEKWKESKRKSLIKNLMQKMDISEFEAKKLLGL